MCLLGTIFLFGFKLFLRGFVFGTDFVAIQFTLGFHSILHLHHSLNLKSIILYASAPALVTIDSADLRLLFIGGVRLTELVLSIALLLARVVLPLLVAIVTPFPAG